MSASRMSTPPRTQAGHRRTCALLSVSSSSYKMKAWLKNSYAIALKPVWSAPIAHCKNSDSDTHGCNGAMAVTISCKNWYAFLLENCLGFLASATGVASETAGDGNASSTPPRTTSPSPPAPLPTAAAAPSSPSPPGADVSASAAAADTAASAPPSLAGEVVAAPSSLARSSPAAAEVPSGMPPFVPLEPALVAVWSAPPNGSKLNAYAHKINKQIETREGNEELTSDWILHTFFKRDASALQARR